MKIAFLLYPTTSVKVDEDSSFWIMHELRLRGHEVCHFESRDLFHAGGRVRAYLTRTKTDAKKGFLPSPKDDQPSALDEFDAVFIRKEPPFDTEYLYALQLLNVLRGRVFVLNDPAGIALCNEKMWALEFGGFAPESLVTPLASEAKSFIRSLRARAVVKPLDNKAGYGIFLTGPNDKNLASMLDQATELGRRRIMVQRYIPHEKTGDKRILILNGEFLGCFARLPASGDFRANLSAGGSMRRAALSMREKKLLEKMAPRLLEHGLYFVGIDVIGGYLSEVNVTSPSGIPELRALEGKKLEKKVADFLEKRVRCL